MDKTLSNNDIYEIVGKEFGIIQANRLNKNNNIEDFLINNMCLIIYNEINKVGHWCCMKRIGKTIYFFDPYGDFIDEQQKYTNKVYDPVLRKLFKKYIIKDKNNNVEYNDNQLQKLKKGVNTCGRWCALFMKYGSVTIDEFNEIFNNYKKYYDLDELITKIT